jgi:hypothetical protein
VNGYLMKDDRGDTVTDSQIVDRVDAVGAIVVLRGPVESSDFAAWRRELRRSARARGLRLSVRRVEELIVISNPEHVVTEEQRAAAFAKISTHPAFQELQRQSPARGPDLRLVPPPE